jgi:hypothetical protein
MEKQRTPSDMFKCLEHTYVIIKQMFADFAEKPESGADYFNPMFYYVVCQAAPRRFISCFKYFTAHKVDTWRRLCRRL